MTLKGSRSGLLGMPLMGTPFRLWSTPYCCRCKLFVLTTACNVKSDGMGEPERMLACRLPTAAPAKYALPLTALPASRVAIFPTLID